MPLLFYGIVTSKGSRSVYSRGGRMIETGVFDSWRLDGFAPRSRLNAVANFWHLRRRKHTLFSWHEDLIPTEQTVILPGLLPKSEALELARVEFDPWIPSPIIFRFRQDYDEVLLYD